MNELMREFKEFVRRYNDAYDDGESHVRFKWGDVERTFSVRDFSIQLNEGEGFLDGMLSSFQVMKENFDLPYCPCKQNFTEENICPCMMVIEEIDQMGQCNCNLFLKDEMRGGEIKNFRKMRMIHLLNSFQAKIGVDYGDPAKRVEEFIVDYRKNQLRESRVDERLEHILKSIKASSSSPSDLKEIQGERLTTIHEEWVEGRLKLKDLIREMERFRLLFNS